MQKQKQNMIAVSIEAKTFVQSLTTSFGGPSKTKEFLALSEREAVDALVEFAQANRYTVTDEVTDEGEAYELTHDGLALEIDRTIALRAATVRANTATAKLAEKEQELAEMKALLAKYQAASATVE
jgi:hypothetical protein